MQRAGDFGTILIAGEAGVGKTRLVAELERHATTAGARVLAGDCIELAEGELPFAPLTGALRPLARELGPAELDALPGREELARLLPELGDPGERWISRDSALDEPLAQSRLFEVLLALFTRLGEDSPVVLVIEDLHWADRSTRDFLSFLIRNAHDARLLLVCTYRSDELHRRHPLRPFLAELERRAVVERLALAPLSREELGGLLVSILGEPPSETLVKDMFERTDGNPFFAEELLAASAECSEIPATLRDALMVRVEALPQQAREILRVAAAAGRRVSHPLLAKVCVLGEAELDNALREAVSSNVLVQDGDNYSFRHALVREAVTFDMLPGERTKLHAELAEALAADPSLGEGRAGTAAAEVAHHWWEAKRLPEALSSAAAASIAAEDVYAFAEAHRFLEHALEIWDQVEDAEQRAGTDRAEMFARAAENANLIGELARSVALTRKAIELVDDDPVRLALLHERLGRYLWVTGDAEAALASYHEAVDLMPPEPPTAELARVLAAHGQILMLRGRPRESRRRCEQAIEVARSVGARAEEGHALNTLGVDISSLGDREQGIAHLVEAKRIAEELGWIDEIGRVYVNLSEEIDWDGRTAEAVELTLEGAEAMRGLGARSYVLFLETEAAQRLVRLGRLDDADRAVRRVLESAPTVSGPRSAVTPRPTSRSPGATSGGRPTRLAGRSPASGERAIRCTTDRLRRSRSRSPSPSLPRRRCGHSRAPSSGSPARSTRSPLRGSTRAEFAPTPSSASGRGRSARARCSPRRSALPRPRSSGSIRCSSLGSMRKGAPLRRRSPTAPSPPPSSPGSGAVPMRTPGPLPPSAGRRSRCRSSAPMPSGGRPRPCCSLPRRDPRPGSCFRTPRRAPARQAPQRCSARSSRWLAGRASSSMVQSPSPPRTAIATRPTGWGSPRR